MSNSTTHSLEGGAGDDRLLHESLLADGRPRFPEESYQQLLRAGASTEEALAMLGYALDRTPLEESAESEEP